MEENKWAFKVFNSDGRLGRFQFAYVFFLGVIGFAVCSAGLVLCRLTFLVVTAYLAVCVMLFWAYTAAVIKRFHDLNRPGTDFFFTLIPVYNIYIFIKILFFKSESEAGKRWEGQSKAHYWMVPLFMLLIPAMFFGIGAGYQASKELPTFPIKINHSYSETDKYSCDYEHGVNVSISAKPTDEKPFSEYTEEDFARLSEKYGTVEGYVKYAFNTDDEHASYFTDMFSGYTYRLEELGGKKFVHVTYLRNGTWVWQHIIGIYESTEYDFQFVFEDDLLSSYYTQAAIQSIRVGEDAVP